MAFEGDGMAPFEEGLSVEQLLENAVIRMMGKQEEADRTPEIDADYAWIRDDEIIGDCMEIFPFLVRHEDSRDVLDGLLRDERWPVRVMANLANFMLHLSDDPDHFAEYENRGVLSRWLDSYRDMDPDPTEP